MLHLIPEFITFVLAILTFKNLDAFSRLIAIQVIIAFLVEFAGWQMRIHQITNVWLYNLYMPIEVSLLLGAASLHFSKKVKLSLLIVFIFYWTCWTIEIYKFSLTNFVVRTYVIGAMILLINYFFVLYKSAWNRKSILAQSGFWFSIATILFFGCNIPFFSMHNYIVENSLSYQMDLLTNLMIVFSHFRYLCLAVGFLVIFLETQRMNLKLKRNAE